MIATHQHSSRPMSRRSGRRGTILIIVLWIALALVALALTFGHSMSMAYRAADQGAAGLAAEQAIEGARRYVAYVLENVAEAGMLPDLELNDYVAEEALLEESTFWLIGRDPDAEPVLEEPVFGLIDEGSKLNLNTATAEMLEILPNMTAELAAAIVDWRDEDEELTEGGAESQDYLMLDEPYEAKNGPFESVEELRLVMGAEPWLLDGEDANRNGVLDPNEDDGDVSWPDDNSDGRLDPGLLEYLTVWTREPNTRADGTAKVDLTANNAPQGLTTLLGEALGETRAAAIMQLVGGSLGSVRSPLEFHLLSGMTADEFALVEDGLTVGSEDYREGLVNVATAPAAVLACLPGMDDALAAQLVGARAGRDLQSRATVAWVAEALTRSQAIEIGPFITGRGQQFSADVVALGPEGRGMRRSFIVFEMTDKARVVYRRDLSRLGWPLGAEIREMFDPTEEEVASRR